jgi:hypothetical protein
MQIRPGEVELLVTGDRECFNHSPHFQKLIK